jgi:uncharacterized protein (DUF2147 family)
MTKRRDVLAIVALATSLLAAVNVTAVSAQAVDKALGVWANEDGEAHIEIAPCGSEICGRIVWLKQPLDEYGQSHTDKNNPNPALRSRAILGLVIMSKLHPNQDNTRLDGEVYNSRNGKVYDIYLTPKGQIMEVEGCLMKYLCASQTWKRVR